MKTISPIWFLKNPIDPEHKEYVLLDYLKSISKNLNSDNCYSILRSVSKIIKVLNDFRQLKKPSEHTLKLVNKEDLKFLMDFRFDRLSTDEQNEIINIIEASLETLYEYSEICLELLKEEESKIKVFKIQSRYNNESEKSVNSGILIIRNMITDDIIAYYWQGAVTLKTSEGNKEICVLKRIHLKNKKYSMNYEFIYHEILEEFSIEKKVSPELYVVEIYENFDENSEIYKLAKEKFIETIS